VAIRVPVFDGSIRQPASCGRAGLAWPEVLFVLSVLLLAASLIIPAALELDARRRSKMAYAEMRTLLESVRRYNLEYRVWPLPRLPDRGDARFGFIEANAGVMRILLAQPGEGNTLGRANPNGIDFVALIGGTDAPVRLDDRGEVIDPWGNPYQIVLDANYDNVVTVPDSGYGSVPGAGVVVWSYGPDGRPETLDDLTSWRR
jgi:type II secretory pathway pseudopilin PulG